MALHAAGAVADESGSPRPSAVPHKEPPPVERTASGGIERPTNDSPRAAGQSEPAESSPSDAGVGLSRPVGPAPANPVTKENQCAAEGELTDPDCRDLTAQERMAYAAWAQVILTAIGVLLIWRTLFHTRVAAEAAKATVVEAEKSTRAAFQAAEATIKANEISRDAHIADQRPWVAAYVEIGGPATWDTSGFHLRFRFILENTGNTPAFKTEIRLKGIAFHEFSDLVKSQLIWANIVRNDPCHLGATLFPNQKKEFREFATITNDEIREALGLSPDEIFPKESNILPAVIGCANYHSVFGGTGHQTGLIFQIRSHAAEEGLVAIHGSEGEIPAEHLGIYAWPLDGRTD